MPIWKRAVLYLTRKRVRSGILILIIFLMSTFLMVGITVRSRAEASVTSLRKSYGSSFRFKWNTEDMSLYEDRVDETGFPYRLYIGPKIPQRLLNRILEIDGVEGYTENGRKISFYVDIELIPGFEAAQYKEFDETDDFGEAMPFRREDYEVSMKTTTLFGCDDSSRQSYFRVGAMKLIRGRHLGKGDFGKVLISKALAEKNHLQLGDTFHVEVKLGNLGAYKDPMERLGEPLELEIAGMFEPTFQQNTGGESDKKLFEDQILDNMLFISMDTFAELYSIGGHEFHGDEYNDLTFFVDDPAKLEPAMEELRTIGEIDWTYFVLTVDDSAYRASIVPLQQISGFSSFLTMASLIGMAILLGLVLVMWMRERKTEIQVLLSIGRKREELVTQMLVETLITSVIALLLMVLVSGGVLREFETLANKLDRTAVTEEKFALDYGYAGVFEPEISQAVPEPTPMDYSVDLYRLAESAGITLGIALTATLLVSLVMLHKRGGVGK